MTSRLSLADDTRLLLQALETQPVSFEDWARLGRGKRRLSTVTTVLRVAGVVRTSRIMYNGSPRLQVSLAPVSTISQQHFLDLLRIVNGTLGSVVDDVVRELMSTKSSSINNEYKKIEDTLEWLEEMKIRNPQLAVLLDETPAPPTPPPT